MSLVRFNISCDEGDTAEAAPPAGAGTAAEMAPPAEAAASAAASAAATAASSSTFAAAAADSPPRPPPHTFNLSYPPPAATVMMSGAAPPLDVRLDSPLHLCTILSWAHVREATRRRLRADPTQWTPREAALSSNFYLLGSARLLCEAHDEGRPCEIAEMNHLRSWQRAWFFVFAGNDDTDRTVVRYAPFGTNSQIQT